MIYNTGVKLVKYRTHVFLCISLEKKFNGTNDDTEQKATTPPPQKKAREPVFVFCINKKRELSSYYEAITLPVETSRIKCKMKIRKSSL